MTAAFVLTRHVKHIGSWTQHSQQLDSWRSGAVRPICGGNVLGWGHTYYPTVRYEDERIAARAARLPVCKPCIRTLRGLLDLAGPLPLTGRAATELDERRVVMRDRLDRLDDGDLERAIHWLGYEQPDLVDDALRETGAPA